MPAQPAVGQIFAREAAPSIAEDRAEIMALGETVTVPAGEFSNTLRMREQNRSTVVKMKRSSPSVSGSLWTPMCS